MTRLPSLSRKSAKVSPGFHGALVLAEDRAALRLSGAYEDQTGWIDNPARAASGVNAGDLLNLRGSLLVAPAPNLSVRLDLIHQDVERESGDVVLYDRGTGEPSAGDLERSAPLEEPFELGHDQAALTLDYDFGGLTLTSITSHARTELAATADLSQSLTRAFLDTLVPPGTIGSVAFDIAADTEKTVQELRLASNGAAPLQWLVGAFYTAEAVGNDQAGSANFPGAGGPIPGLAPFALFGLDSEFTEYAAFGTASYDLNDRWRIEGGLRWSRNEQEFTQSVGGFALPTTTSEEDRTDYAATLRYRVDEDDYAYLRAATGYRAGGPNVTLPTAPATFGADQISNYEIGYKGRFGAFSLDAAVYHIDWQDIQLIGTDPSGFTFRANGGGASSQGVELAGAFDVTDAFTLGGSLAYTDSQLEDDAPGAGGVAGEQLPNTPELSAALLGDYRFPVSSNLEAFVGATVRYVGDRTSSFNADLNSPQFELDAYTLTDLRLGIDGGGWRLTGFMRNAFDEHAELAASTSFYVLTDQAAMTVARPRTIGVVLSADF